MLLLLEQGDPRLGTAVATLNILDVHYNCFSRVMISVHYGRHSTRPWPLRNVDQLKHKFSFRGHTEYERTLFQGKIHDKRRESHSSLIRDGICSLLPRGYVPLLISQHRFQVCASKPLEPLTEATRTEKTLRTIVSLPFLGCDMIPLMRFQCTSPDGPVTFSSSSRTRVRTRQQRTRAPKDVVIW
jgi:hypothetical protein